MNKIITDVIFPEKETIVEVVLYKFSRFLFNDGNKLFFESGIIKNSPEDELEKHKFHILKYTKGMVYPSPTVFVCSYEDNSHERYFVFEDATNDPFTQFGKMFGF